MKKELLAAVLISPLLTGCLTLEERMAFSLLGTPEQRASILARECAAMGLPGDKDCMLALHHEKMEYMQSLGSRSSGGQLATLPPMQPATVSMPPMNPPMPSHITVTHRGL